MYPRLDDVVKAADVQQKGTGKYVADYVNWSRIAHYLREHAPGWQPFAAPAADGGLAHKAPDGTYYLLIGFRHPDPEQPDTEVVPHAIMDHRLDAKKNPDARDIADSFVRGMCKAAALLFGLGWKLWSKDDPMAREEAPPPPPPEPFELVEHAVSAMEHGMPPAEWQARVKASGFSDGDKEVLRNAIGRRKEAAHA